MTLKGKKIIVSGKVQGVGFRYFTSLKANALNLNGHAKNLKDGSVEVIIYGNDENINEICNWLRFGPKTSLVSDLKVTSTVYLSQDGFLIL